MKQKRFSLVLLAIMMVWTVSFADNVSQFLQTKATTVLRAAHPTSTLDRGTATCTYEGYGWYKLSMHITAVWNSGYDFSISFHKTQNGFDQLHVDLDEQADAYLLSPRAFRLADGTIRLADYLARRFIQEEYNKTIAFFEALFNSSISGMDAKQLLLVFLSVEYRMA